jgi:hypothetical protein
VDLAALDTATAAASAALGGGLRCTALELFLVDRIAATGGMVDPEIWARELGPELPEDQAARLAEAMRSIAAKRTRAWRLAGLG